MSSSIGKEVLKNAMSPHKGGFVAFSSDNVWSQTRKLLDVMLKVFVVRIAHPSLRPRHDNAAADGVNEETVSDTHGR